MVDKAKLEEWRQRYEDKGTESIQNPLFREVANKIFDENEKRFKPYEGIPTLLDAPAQQGLEGLDIALIGVPMDLGVTNRPGARFGPRALRAIERIGPYHHALETLPSGLCKFADVGDVPLASRYSLQQSIADIEAYYHDVAAAGVRPLTAGGDHSITCPIMKAVGAKEPVGMIHIDAHCDTSGPFEGEKFHHGGPFRQAVLAGVLDPERCIQIGIRGSAEYLWEFSYDTGMTVIHAHEFAEMGVEAVIAKARQVVGDGPTYITLDVDGIDPAFTPGTGTPEVGGLTPLEVQRLFWGLKGLNIVAGDVVEVAPQYDANTNTAHVGAQMLFEILCLMALSPGIGK